MDGAQAEAIRDAESALAGQQSVVAQVDLQVITAVLNAHSDHDRATGELERLQQDVETAVAARTDLGTPAGARSFQRYLIGKLRDIRAVVDDADLDATSKATLAAALSSLYASTGDPDQPAEPRIPLAANESGIPPEEPPAEPTPAAEAPAPAAPPAAGGSPAMPMPAPPSLPEFSSPPDLSPLAERIRHSDPQPDEPTGQAQDIPVDAPAPGNSERPELAGVITAAVAGTPIPEAFSRQGITIPPPGSPVDAPLDPAQLVPGDIGVFGDRHALALGNGNALLDNQIQPVTAIGGPGFIGWQHPPAATPVTA